VNKPRLLTVGEAMLRFSPPIQQSLVDSANLEVSVGGAELNVAIAAKCMGLDSSWLSQLPNGVLAEKIIRHARHHSIEPIISIGEGRVGIYFAEVGNDPRGVTVTYDRDFSAARSLTPEAIAPLISGKDFSAVFASGITLALGEGPREAVYSIFSESRSWRRYFEINHRSKLASSDEMTPWVLDLLPHTDVLFASTHDFTEILKLGEDVGSAAKQAIEKYQLEYVVVPDRSGRVGELGTNSLRVIGHDVDVYQEFHGRVVDPIGAGDAGAGTFIACIEQGMDVESAAQCSVIASAWTQTHTGDAASFQRNDIVALDGRRIRR
jgi:2-dehydro-3-deoxygluconokinase